MKHIAMAADKNYALPMYISMISAMNCCNNKEDLQFILLISEDFPDFFVELINEAAFKNRIQPPRFLSMKDSFEDLPISIPHTSIPTYYRLLLPELCPDVDTCLYMDVDTLVCKDLTELLSYDMGEHYLAGVKAAAYYYPPKAAQHRAEKLGIAAFDQYVNAGILLLNLKKIREDGLQEIVLKMTEKGYGSQDQDILNIACYGKIAILPPKYNLMTKYPVMDIDDYERTDCLKICYTKEEWQEAVEDPVIIHYADNRKPWVFSDVQRADRWQHIFRNVFPKLMTKESFLDHWINFMYHNNDIQEKTGQKRNASLVGELEHRKQQLAESWERNARLSKDRDALEQRRKESVQEVTKLKEKLKEAVEDSARAKAELKSRSDELSKCRLHVGELNTLLQQTAAEKAKINNMLQQVYKDKSELNTRLQKAYAEKSELNSKLQKTYTEKSELNAKLQQTYAEKSEINAKLKQAYADKTKRGLRIKELEKELEEETVFSLLKKKMKK
ncbi:MAG: hypothetical protein IKE21_02660 [Erysipelotrichaceae bacterium]|nr:hypothetical protein [Erysipelotrichaceae bacterium]